MVERDRLASDRSASREPRSAEWGSTLTLILVLLGYANGSAWLATRRAADLPVGLNRGHVGMLILMLAWAWRERVALDELGLAAAMVRRGVIGGAAVGLASALPICLFFRWPRIAGWPIEIGEYRALGRWQLVRLLVGQLLIGSALFEEVAFRGLLHAKLRRHLGGTRALAAGSLVFAGWHAVIAWHNVRRCNVGAGWFAPIYGAVLGVLFVAGWLFGTVRDRTGHVAGSVVTHWALIVALLFEITRLGGRKDGRRCDVGETEATAAP